MQVFYLLTIEGSKKPSLGFVDKIESLKNSRLNPPLKGLTIEIEQNVNELIKSTHRSSKNLTAKSKLLYNHSLFEK